MSETCDNVESGDESDDDSTMPPLIRKEKMDAIYSGDEVYDDPMSMYML